MFVDPIVTPAAWATIYAFIKYWGPVLGFFGILIKAYASAKKSVSTKFDAFLGDVNGWADKLLNNHLKHIEIATTETATLTEKTNALLVSTQLNDAVAATKAAEVAMALHEHNDRQAQVWQGVVTQLSVLEDRTRRERTPRPRKKKV